MASRNYYRGTVIQNDEYVTSFLTLEYAETGHPLLIDELGRAWRPDDFSQEAFDKLNIAQLLQPDTQHRQEGN